MDLAPSSPLAFIADLPYGSEDMRPKKKKILLSRNLIASFLFLSFLAGGWNSVAWCYQAMDRSVQGGSAAVSGHSAQAPAAEKNGLEKAENSRCCLKLPPALVSDPATPSPERKQSPVRLLLTSSSLVTAFSQSADRGGRYFVAKAPPPNLQLAHLRTVVLLN